VEQPVDDLARAALTQLLDAPAAIPTPMEPSLRIGNSCCRFSNSVAYASSV
jgi:hypothetical protein